MYIHRELEGEIKPFLKRKEVIAITGSRQAGKTTFLQHLESELKKKKKKVKNITFEKRSDLALFQDNIEDFKLLAKQYEYIIIDEFQYAKEGGQKLKYLYDTLSTKFIISGSSSLELTFATGKYMVGRMFSFELSPFSFREFLSFEDPEFYYLLEKKIKTGNILEFEVKSSFGQEINNELAEKLGKYIVYGGYPAVVLSKTEAEKKKILESIVDNYLLRDIQGLLHLATEDQLIKLGRLLATQIANMVKYEELSRTSGLSYQEVLKHLTILEKTFILSLIKPFFTNRRTELTKNPKVFFRDLGLRNYLLTDFRPIEIRNELGALMENQTFIALHRISPNLKYWRTKSKAEVDFVIAKAQKLFPIEVKYSSKHTIGKSLHSFINKFHPQTVVIVTKNLAHEEKIAKSTIKFIPLSYF